MLEIDKTIFNQNLLLTQAYCELQLKNTHKNYASILRSFNPVYDGKELFSFEFMSHNDELISSNWVTTKWGRDPFESNFYDELFKNQLEHKNEVLRNIGPKEYSGKILIVEIDQTLRDGASEEMSDGLIDGNDCPPIDSWFYKTQNEKGQLLFAWIPEPFELLANDGIAVNSIDCLYWYTVGRSTNSNWHAENLGETPPIAATTDENPPSILSQIKKMFS